MNNYILTLVLKPDLEEKPRKQLLESVTKRFGKIEKEEEWGARDLAYPVKKNKKGWYAHYRFEADPQNVKPLDNALKMEEDIIRYLLIREK